jgi:small-conductance mechanosensitive channel
MDIKNRPARYRSLNKISLEKKETVNRVWIGSYSLLAAGSLSLFFLVRLGWLRLDRIYTDTLEKIALATFFATVVLAAARLAELIVLKKSQTVHIRYNLIRMIRLVSVFIIIGIALSFLFSNWYSAAVSLGLISLILGFALQTPISSFIGWLYILIRQPFHVGDRIQIDTFRGDVVEVNYLDTTLWEFSGDYLTNDLPSGRLIRFPNSLVLESAVFNYSWEKFPYIWNEIPFHLAYESDLQFVEDTIREVTKKELGPGMEERIRTFKKLVEQTPVDAEGIREYPFVTFRVSTNTWVEALVTYLVDPKQAATTRNRLVKSIISALQKSPERVLFPKSNAR